MKHRMNTGPNAKLCAGIIGGKVRIWHYLPATWNKAAAVDFYTKVLSPALKHYHGDKKRYTIIEDNDPTGYKSGPALEAKASLKIHPMEFPRYSPDLNPLDFALWNEVERRMSEQEQPEDETVDEFKARLRRTALMIPKAVVTKMLASVKHRAQIIYDNNGGNGSRD